MSNPADKAASPANAPEKKVDARSRVPMSVPQRHLEIPDMPGYHLHWFLTSRVGRALRAGYEYVDPEDVDVNNFDIAGDASASGNSDLGSRVSVPAAIGGDSDERLYLMRIRQEWWEQDQEALADTNEGIAKALRGGKGPGVNGANPYDTSQEYTPGGRESPMQSNLFTPKRPR